MVDKGALKTEQEGRKFIYSAAVTEAESIDIYTEDVLSRVCNKQSGKVIGNMIADATLSKSDVDKLKDLLEEIEKGEKTAKNSPGANEAAVNYRLKSFKPSSTKEEVKVDGMKCAGCANTVQERFTAINGVESVTIDLESKKAVLESQTDLDTETLNAALAETNYSVVNA